METYIAGQPNIMERQNKDMTWITSWCKECGNETYTKFNRHAYAMDDDYRRGEQNVPICNDCEI